MKSMNQIDVMRGNGRTIEKWNKSTVIKIYSVPIKVKFRGGHNLVLAVFLQGGA